MINGAECLDEGEIFDDLSEHDDCPNDPSHAMGPVTITKCPTDAGTTLSKRGDCNSDVHHWGRGDHVESVSR